MMTRRILAVSLLLAAPVSAQNVLSNPSFAVDTSDWTFPSYDTGAWDAFSRGAGTGSAHVTSLVRPGTLDAPNTSAEQCVEVIAGRTYVFGGHVYVPGDVAPAAAITAFVDARFFAGSSCAGGEVEQHIGSITNAPRDTWLGVQTSAVAPAGTGSARVEIGGVNFDGSAASTSIEVYVDDAFALLDRACADTETDLCLNGGRFRAHGSFRVPAQGREGPMHALPVTVDSGLFWFFSRDNLEVFLKVLNACSLAPPRYWVFASGLTNVEVTLIVDDTVSGEERTYFNASGTAFAPVQDTSAFATCP